MRTKMKKILYVILSTVLVFTLISANLGTIKVSAEGANPKVNNVTEDNNIKVSLLWCSVKLPVFTAAATGIGFRRS